MKTHPLKIIAAILVCVSFLTSNATRAADTDTNSAIANNPAPRLVIVKAVYGDLSTPDASSEVTAQVAGMITNDTLTVDASNDNFGDPASGVCKQLKVDFKFDGVPATKSVYERGTLRISSKDKPDPTQTAAPKLVIRKAVYGNLPDGDSIDVTTIIAGMIRSNSLTFKVNNDDLGDPAPDDKKELHIDYTFNGKDDSQTVADGKTLKIPAASE